ncbi:MAG TPA: NAD(P)/FAD-dependent oxidoreductase [Devosiaceae bacterium]|jgi:thioredoxin reductase|nr:NAD(P)/FAD-dependent oxidoreductase [Devosiaceae bacterium]
MHDVIIIGGSFAGLTAATQLGRARRDVLVLDTGLPRNRFSEAAHGLLGHDGKPPADILEAAREQLGVYGSVTIRDAEAAAASRSDGGFAVETADGDTVRGRKLILAHGVSDQLAPIPGLAECWGRTVLHCPYCHGFEMADRRLGMLVRRGMELQLARLYRDWSSQLTMFSNGAIVDDLVRAGLDELGVPLVESLVLRIDHEEGHLKAVETADEQVQLDALFAPAPTDFTSRIGIDLGCAVDEGPVGPFFTTDGHGLTSVDGVYAAGDIIRQAHSLGFAVADGVAAGVAAHHALLEAS